jgi:hypothetical protein
MQIIPVNDKATHQLFMSVPLIIYKNDRKWIRPLDKDVEEVFDAKKNKAFRFGKIQRWILKNEEGELIGRIAAFINKKYKNKGDEGEAGGMGFFECINNQDAADLLFNNVKHWLLNEGMQTMDGPINFGERDKWWGLVTEGFIEPLYGMNYNPPYYKTLFENYGFKCFYEQICVGMKVKKPLQPRIWERHDLVEKDPGFSARFLKKSQLENYAADFTEVYNKAWAGHGGLKQLTIEQVVIMFKKMKPVMDERILWFAYYNDAPIAIFINLPDLNQWFKHLNGKFGLLHKLYFLLLKTFKPNKKFTGLVFGIVPEFQGQGVDAYIIAESAKVLQSNNVPYTDYEMQWIGDFNPKMLNIAQNLGEVYTSRKLATYRYMFDQTIPFKRHPIL